MSFGHLYRDPVLIVLLAASIISWAIILDRLLALYRTASADRAFQSGGPAPGSPLSCLNQEANRHAGTAREHLLTIMDTAITLQRQHLERYFPVLGAIGSTAPYVGLLGTVIGIIQAFQAIHTQNNMSPSVVAEGIATALIATAAGLAVAIPAVVAHHLLCAAVNRRVSLWESIAARWLAGNKEKEVPYEPISLK